MKNYLVVITFDDPFPKEFSYTIAKISNIAMGAYRTIKLFRAENKGRRVKNLKINITQL